MQNPYSPGETTADEIKPVHDTLNILTDLNQVKRLIWTSRVLRIIGLVIATFPLYAVTFSLNNVYQLATKEGEKFPAFILLHLFSAILSLSPLVFTWALFNRGPVASAIAVIGGTFLLINISYSTLLGIIILFSYSTNRLLWSKHRITDAQLKNAYENLKAGKG